ncbi:MAG: ribosome maturation factor RimP [Hyphomicrobiaceae bacterium]
MFWDIEELEIMEISDRTDIVSAPSNEARFIQETGAAAGIAALVEPVLVDMGYRLVLVRILQGQGMIVEIMAERPDGTMTIEDCRSVSLGLSPVLDVHDPVSGSYRLQISSPGIDRPLVRPSDFNQWAGFEAKIELKELIDGRRRFRGILEGFEDGEIRIEVDLGKDAGLQVLGLPLALVEDARLMLTDDLVRESLRRTKQLMQQSGREADLEDEAGTGEGEATAGLGDAGSIKGGQGGRTGEKKRAGDRKPARKKR